MFAILLLSDSVQIPNGSLTESVKETVIRFLKEKYESMVKSELGYVIMVIDADVDTDDTDTSTESITYNNVNFKALTFYPKLQEIVEGELVAINDFGGFVRIGPIDALIHLSQIADERVVANVREGIIRLVDSGRSIQIGSRLRGRITAVSPPNHESTGKVSLSCREFLGSQDWSKSEKVSICDHCGKKVGWTFRCRRCGGDYCDDHRLPENHDCERRPRKLHSI